MFELGWIEIAVIGVIALVVLGPERLPKAARFAGLWVRKARAQWFAVKSEMERELAAEELKASLQAERESIREAVKQLDEEAKAVRGTLDGIHADRPDEPHRETDAAPPVDPPPAPGADAVRLPPP